MKNANVLLNCCSFGTILKVEKITEMKKEHYFLYLILGVVLVLGLYDLLYYFGVLEIPEKLMLILNIIIPFQFITGGLIVTFGDSVRQEAFAQRFLILTTYQMFLVMIVLIAVWIMAKPDLKVFSFHFLGLLFVMKAIQSALLIRYNRKNQ